MQACATLETKNGRHAVLEAVRVEAAIRGLFCETTLTQSYLNEGRKPLEAVYTFPLPLDAVLLGFELEIGGRRLTAQVFERKTAETTYEEAMTEGDAAVLLEEAGPGLYTANIGALLPGERATIRIRFAVLLRWSGDRVRLSLPTTIAPRYGAPAAGGLAAHQEPVHTLAADRSFDLCVSIRGILAEAELLCPSHEIAVRREGEETTLTLLGRPAMDRDVVIEARAEAERADAALVARDLDGWVALASFRPEIAPEGDVRPARRSVTVVADCSGSMAGDSIAQARAALARILGELREDDLFEIVAFGDRPHPLFGRETPVTEASLSVAQGYVDRLDANLGGTEIGVALDAVYATPGERRMPRDVLLITDGQAWERDLVERARVSGRRIFTVGVGSAVAEDVVRGLAEATGGACELVSPNEDMPNRIHRHFQRLYAAPTAEVRVCWPVEPRRTLPRTIRTVFAGDTLHAFAWFATKPEGAARLEVRLENGRSLTQSAVLRAFAPAGEAETEAAPALARIAAAKRLAEMGEARGRKTEATELALRHQLLSRWTSCVVTHVREDGTKAEDLPEVQVVQQVLAAGWGGFGSVTPTGIRKIEEMALRKLKHPSRSRKLRSFLDPDGARARMMVEPMGDFGPGEPLALGDASEDLVAPEMDATELAARVARVGGTLPLTIDALAALGLPVWLTKALRAFVGAEADEEAVALAFLLHLIDSPAVAGASRAAFRPIRRAAKTRPPAPELLEAVEMACGLWLDRKTAGPAGGLTPREERVLQKRFGIGAGT